VSVDNIEMENKRGRTNKVKNKKLCTKITSFPIGLSTSVNLGSVSICLVKVSKRPVIEG
jgi:hypothetical protein